MAVVGGDGQRLALRGLFSAVRARVVLLVRVDAAYSGDLVFGRRFAAAVASKFTSRLRCRSRVFLDGPFLANDGNAARLVRSGILHVDLSGDVGMVLWVDAAARKIERGRA